MLLVLNLLTLTCYVNYVIICLFDAIRHQPSHLRCHLVFHIGGFCMEFNEWYLSSFSRNSHKVTIRNYRCSLDCVELITDELTQLTQLALTNSCIDFDVSEDENTEYTVATFIFADESGWKQFCDELVKLFNGCKNKQE